MSSFSWVELWLPICRYLLRLGLCPEDVEDVAQETFLRLFNRLLEPGKEESLRGWGFRVAHNIALNQLRYRNRLRAKSQGEWEELNELMIDPYPNPEQTLLGKERIATIDRAKGRLTRRQWQCLSLRLKGFGYREIGEILGVKVSTVAESLHRAIEKLRGETMRQPWEDELRREERPVSQ